MGCAHRVTLSIVIGLGKVISALSCGIASLCQYLRNVVVIENGGHSPPYNVLNPAAAGLKLMYRSVLPLYIRDRGQSCQQWDGDRGRDRKAGY